MKILVIVIGKGGSGKELIVSALVKDGFSRTSMGNLPIVQGDLIVTETVRRSYASSAIDYGKRSGYQVRIISTEVVSR